MVMVGINSDVKLGERLAGEDASLEQLSVVSVLAMR